MSEPDRPITDEEWIEASQGCCGADRRCCVMPRADFPHPSPGFTRFGVTALIALPGS